MENGWIKLHRKLLDNPIAKKPAWLTVWVHLLLLANHQEKSFIWNGTAITIHQGQLITGRNELAKQCGVSPSLVERVLKYLEIEQQIGQQKTTKYRLITVLKWKDYQKSDSTSDNKRTTDGQQADTNKNVRKKECKKDTAPEGADKPRFYPLGAEVVKAFEAVDSKNKTYYNNITQRLAADFLIAEYSIERVLKVIAVLPKTNRIPYFPTITSPYDLKENWTRLEAAFAKKKVELQGKGKEILV